MGAPPVAVTTLRSGGCGTIVRVDGDSEARLRLAELGLTPSADIRVIVAARRHPLILEVRGARLALDPQVADLVWVDCEPADPAQR
jgi:Fe2+ transport system protein FeoA